MSGAPRLGLVAGEASGDRLGAALMTAIRARRPRACFVGVGGPAMREAGLQCLHAGEALAINGLREPLRRLPALRRLLRTLERTFDAARLDAFVGIDFNVFNLILERRLRRPDRPVIHYVSPSVYAWRRGRVRTVAAAADRLLTLYPFEAACYAGTGLDVVHVGHPLADALAPSRDPLALRAELDPADAGARLLAVLPGSRAAEIEAHAAPFLEAAQRLRMREAERRGKDLRIVVAVLDEAAASRVRALTQRAAPDARIVVGRSREVLAAADLALVKAGTGTLEAMFAGTPMVVAYRLGALTHAVLARLVHTPHVALPNLLAGRALVPELIQDAMTPERLTDALAAVLRDGDDQRAAFAELARVLPPGAAGRAAEAVLELAEAKRA